MLKSENAATLPNIKVPTYLKKHIFRGDSLLIVHGVFGWLPVLNASAGVAQLFDLLSLLLFKLLDIPWRFLFVEGLNFVPVRCYFDTCKTRNRKKKRCMFFYATTRSIIMKFTITIIIS